MNRILLTIAAAALFAGCTKDQTALPDTPGGGDFTISASRVDPSQPAPAAASQNGSDVYFDMDGYMYDQVADTRTALDPIAGLNVFWSDNDRIGLCQVASGTITGNRAFDETNADGTSGKAIFLGSNPGTGDFVAYYPFNPSALADGKVAFTLPAQTQSANGIADRFGEYSFMYTQPVSIEEDATNVAMNFQHAFSVVEVSFTPNLIGATAPLTVNSIELRDNTVGKTSFCTTATLDATGAVTFSGAASSVNLTLGGGTGVALSTIGTTFRGWVVVAAPAESAGNQIDVVINTSAGTYTFQRAIPEGGFKPGGRYALRPYDPDAIIVFSDPKLKTLLVGQIGWDANKDGELSVGEVAGITEIVMNTNPMKELEIIDGMSSFRGLKILRLSNGPKLTKVDVSGCMNLTELQCRSCSLVTSLDLSKTPALQMLWCDNTGITSLDVSKNPALKDLNFGTTTITSIDLSKNPALQRLTCGTTSLTSLDLSNNPALTYVNCRGSKSLKTIDVSNSPLLQTLDCHTTGLTALDVSKNPALQTLMCSYSNVAAIDVSKNPVLTQLDCALCTNLTTINLTGAAALSSLNCSESDVRSLDLSQCVALTRLTANRNMAMSGKIDVSNSPNVNYLNIKDTGVTELDITGCTKITSGLIIAPCPLQKLTCSNTNLTPAQLNLSPLAPTLELLVCDNMSKLTGVFNLSGFTKLTRVNCNNTAISSLNISGCTALKEAYCQNNSTLTSLNVTGSTLLNAINCSTTGLTGTLDLSTIDPVILLQCQDTGVNQILIREGQSFMAGSNLNGVTPTVIP